VGETEPTETEPTETEPILIDEPILLSHIVYYKCDNIVGAEEFADEILDHMYYLIEEAHSGKYTEDASAQMFEEVSRLAKIQDSVRCDIDEMELWASREKEYYYATRLWLFLKEHGYSDEVCAGIMGNFMTETGGDTLKLRPHIYDSTGYYYGMAMWCTYYYHTCAGMTFEEQCQYLVDTMQMEFDKFGHMYCEGFDYEDFIGMTSPKEIALAFAKVYERRDPVSHVRRQRNAVVALDYFTQKLY
jgi:hypothetical protein